MGGSLRQAFDEIPTLGGGPARARLLVDNLAAWIARWRLMRSARARLDAMSFILERDAFGYAFLGHLLKLQRSGVAVRLMTDAAADPLGRRGFKAHSGGRDYLQELVGAGAKAGIYHPLWHRPFRILSLGVMACNHDKTLVADGERAITGGRNISHEYFVDPLDLADAWRDTDALIEGTGPAQGLTRAFDREFERAGVVVQVRRERLNLRRRELELLGAYLLMDTALHRDALAAEEKAHLRANDAARDRLARSLLDDAVARLPEEGVTRRATGGESRRLLVLARELAGYPELVGSATAATDAQAHDCEVKIIDQTAASGGRVNELAAALVSLVNATRHRVILENPYVVLTEEMLATLEGAARRGVEVHIGTNSPLSSDSAVTQAFFLEDWTYILARVPTARIFVATGKARLHAKVATLDDEVTVVSTYNMDFMSGFVNSEVGAVIWSPGFTAATQRSFDADRLLPANGVLEYRVRRDGAGRPVVVNGEPVAEFGPEQHLDEALLRQYAPLRRRWNLLRRLRRFESLRRPPLGPTEAPPRR